MKKYHSHDVVPYGLHSVEFTFPVEKISEFALEKYYAATYLDEQELVVFKFRGYSLIREQYGGHIPKFSSFQELLDYYESENIEELQKIVPDLNPGETITMFGEELSTGQLLPLFRYDFEKKDWYFGVKQYEVEFWGGTVLK